jgi:thiopeptide-type bacteriocin biosynthesis protein
VIDPDAVQPGPGGRWCQVNCSVFTQATADGPVPYIPWKRLAEAVEGWRREGRFDRFFFVRKPPGLRLRFTPGDRGGLEPPLAAWLAAREAGNELRGFRFTVYEPEEHRFGGPSGMDLAHELFDADARTALEYERHAEGADMAASRAELSAALTEQLLSSVLDDPAEAWDVWCRLRQAVRDSPVGTAAGARTVDAEDTKPEGAEPATVPSHSAASRLPPAVVAAYRAQLERQRSLASLLRATADAGLLTVGVRSWLVSATVFHWNRWGLPLDPVALIDLTERMVTRLAPEGRGPADR